MNPISLTESDLVKLRALKELCIDDDLLDLPAYDSISRADKIQQAWEALHVIDKICDESLKEIIIK